MKSFMDKDFLLENKPAEVLFFDYAEKMPIIDYHCHIDPREIYENRRFRDITEAWLEGDHYKWRLMRANGAGERFVTGDACNREKFLEFASMLPRAAGNPVYHWAHLELRRFFGCEKPLGPETAREVWDFCNDRLSRDEGLSVRGIIRRAEVEVIVTTDDPADDLEWHKKLAADKSFETKVLPGWRPTKALDVENAGFAGYVRTLGEKAGVRIESIDDLKTALIERMEYFRANGCRACDHGIEHLAWAPAADGQFDDIFKKGLRGEPLTTEEVEKYRYGLLSFCAGEYARLGWVMQLHLGVMRNINTAMFNRLGPDTGYDCVGITSGITGLAKFFDELELNGSLPKTLVFSVDPAENPAINTIAGCFHQEGVKGKVQQGSAWWFNDTGAGMEQQIINFAEEGVLGNFVGMLTDSRSFLSYTRHEYFRRILCNILGGWVDSGRYPDDMVYLGGLVQDICYYNSRRFFGFV